MKLLGLPRSGVLRGSESARRQLELPCGDQLEVVLGEDAAILEVSDEDRALDQGVSVAWRKTTVDQRGDRRTHVAQQSLLRATAHP